MAKPTKRPWLSKTLWFNVISGLIAVASSLSTSDKIPSEYLVAFVALGNVVLRVWFSDTKLTLK